MRWTWTGALICLLALCSCEGSPTLPPQIQGAGYLSPSPSVAACELQRLKQTRILARDAGWKRHLDRMASGHSVGIAVGVNGILVYEHGARYKRTPASNQKLMLSMALFDRLGPRFRIRTTAAGRRTERGVVKGPLWILGGGDPTLTTKQSHFWGSRVNSPTLEELAQHIRSAGIEHVRGAVRGASDYFSHDFNAPGWEPYVPKNYVELPASLSVNGNFHVQGKPERAAARTLERQLMNLGIQVDERSSAGKSPAGLSPIASVRSAPLSEIVSFMDQTSNNFYAEMLGKLLGATVYGPPGTIAKGARAITAWTRGFGVKNVAYDSSGLSYRDKVSPLDLVKLLSAAEREPWGAVLRRALPGPGEGTLRGRLAGLNVRAKTGTLFNADSALSGWVRAAEERPWVEFSILDQGMPKSLEDRMVSVIAHSEIRLPGHIRTDCL